MKATQTTEVKMSWIIDGHDGCNLTFRTRAEARAFAKKLGVPQNAVKNLTPRPPKINETEERPQLS